MNYLMFLIPIMDEATTICIQKVICDNDRLLHLYHSLKISSRIYFLIDMYSKLKATVRRNLIYFTFHFNKSVARTCIL